MNRVYLILEKRRKGSSTSKSKSLPKPQAFSYYDTTMAVINAHLPATSLYTSSAPQAPLDEREKHIESMLHELRIGAGNQMWDAQLQYHHGTYVCLKGLVVRSTLIP